jgi:tetratricopeptide (TPR) repeat protein
MLVLNLSQWDDLTVVDHGRVPTLLARHKLDPAASITVAQARELAREAGAWTVVLGEFDQAGDSLHVTARVYDVASGERVDLASVSDIPGSDVRPMFDQLTADLLDVSGAPDNVTADLARATTSSLEAYRAYLRGVNHLNNWELGEAVTELERATAIDTTFGLAYYSLAMARGWIIGPDDQESNRAIAQAGRYSAHLPVAQRTLIRAYRAFLEGEFASARRYYQELLARGLHTTEAWYGLGDAWFHDEQAPWAERWTNALRAFTRTVEIDPGFTLAFEHVDFMLHTAGRAYPHIALVTPDSFVRARDEGGDLLMDSVALGQAVDRARDQSLQLAQNWVAYQPNGLRAQHALVDAYANSGEYRSALAETDQMEVDGTPHPELPFVRARIFFASGDAGRAGETLREAMDSVTPQDFAQLDRDMNLVQSVEASANVFAYGGNLAQAAQTIRFADQVRTVLAIRPATHNTDLDPLQNQRRLLSHLYSSAGAPVAMQRRVWESAAEAARRAPAEDRAKVAYSGAAAALGIFLQTNDTTALTELRALTGQEFSREVRAWLAINEDDLDGARAILESADSTTVYRSNFGRPMQAEVYFALGDFWKTVSLLEEFQPDHFPTDYFDSRWGMLGRVRMLRAMAYEEMGRIDEAQEEYREVVAQWQSADEPFEALRVRAEERLASLAGQAS